MSVCLAVDIGSYYIKVVEGYAKRDKIVIKTAGVTRNPFPNAHISLNENLQKQFSNFLRNFLKKLGIKRKETVCCITGEDLIIHYFDIPDVPENEINNIIELELLQIVPGGIDKIEYDYTIFSSRQPGKKNILLAGIPKIKCDFFVNTLIMSGLKPIIMDVGGLALANCYLTLNKQKSETQLIINTGASRTNIAIIEKDGFIFIREIDFGGDVITREISREKNISINEAEQLKKKPEFKNELEKILKNISIDTFQEISTSLKYFETRTNKKVEKFLLTGGSSLLPGFVKILEELLKIPGEIWAPMSGLYEYCKTDEPKCVEVCFSQALGLVTRKLI